MWAGTAGNTQLQRSGESGMAERWRAQVVVSLKYTLAGEHTTAIVC